MLPKVPIKTVRSLGQGFELAAAKSVTVFLFSKAAVLVQSFEKQTVRLTGNQSPSIRLKNGLEWMNLSKNGI